MQSVHLQAFPVLNIVSNDQIVAKMDLIRDICNAVFSLRKEANIRVRMPLSKITICGDVIIDNECLSIIKQEVNVKDVVVYTDDIEKIATTEIVFNMKECGKLFGSDFKQILLDSKTGNWKINNGVLCISGHEINSSLYKAVYKPRDNSMAMLCNNYNLLIMIDTNLTHDLVLEGLCRDMVRIIQQRRKDDGLEIADRIFVKIFVDNSLLEEVLSVWGDFIKEQTLAENIEIVKNKPSDFYNTVIDNYSFSLKIEKK